MKISEMIKSRKKKTTVRVYLKKEIKELKEAMYHYVVIGEWKQIKQVLDKNQVNDYIVETLCVNSALDLNDNKEMNARIEYGAIIRENVRIGNGAVILMGAILNTGSFVGDKTMIDMGAVLGGNAIVKENCHIGANAVLAGTIEPYCEKSVVVEKNCFIGAGAVILEGVHIGEGSIIGANAVVRNDIEAFSVAVGVPAKVIRTNDSQSFIEEELREL